MGGFGAEKKNPYFHRRWWARLLAKDSKSRAEKFSQLTKHPELLAAFDQFQHLPALYVGLRLSQMGKIISLRCDEVGSNPNIVNSLTSLQEILISLKQIRNFWYSVFEGHEPSMEKLDVTSVKAVELTAPGAYSNTAIDINSQILTGKIFSAYTKEEQIRIMANLCSNTTDCLVPSLYGFFENIKYLKHAADCLKRVFDIKPGKTVRSTLAGYFPEERLNDKCRYVQVAESSFKRIPVTETTDHFDIVQRQIWLYAFREYPEMPAEQKKKLAGPKGGIANEQVIHRLGSLASQLGFECDEIRNLLQRDPERDMTRRFLNEVRNPSQYKYEDIENTISKILDLVASTRNLEHPGTNTLITSRKPQLCGTPNFSDHPRIKSFAFLNNLHAPTEQVHTETCCFVQRSIYFSFFGKEIGIDINNLRNLPTVSWDGNLEFDQPLYDTFVEDSPEEERQNTRLEIATVSSTLITNPTQLLRITENKVCNSEL